MKSGHAYLFIFNEPLLELTDFSCEAADDSDRKLGSFYCLRSATSAKGISS